MDRFEMAAKEYKEAQEQRRAAEKREKQAQKEMLALFNEGETWLDHFVVKLTMRPGREVFELEDFKEKHPRLAKRFTRMGEGSMIVTVNEIATEEVA